MAIDNETIYELLKAMDAKLDRATSEHATTKERVSALEARVQSRDATTALWFNTQWPAHEQFHVREEARVDALQEKVTDLVAFKAKAGVYIAMACGIGTLVGGGIVTAVLHAAKLG